MEYRVKAKKDGKYWTFGSIKEGKYGPQLSFKKTPELMALINAPGEWLNFALFEDQKKPIDPETQRMVDQIKSTATLNDEIPF